MAMNPWLEVALNGPWTRSYQPRIPVTVDEIVEEAVACVEEGAAIVHVHAYDAETGRQKDDPDLYARIIEGIRARVDAIVYPTVPFASRSQGPGASRLEDRFAAIEELGRRGLLEWSVVDLGSLNFVRRDELQEGEGGFIHTNSLPEIRANLDLAVRFGFHPSYTVYEAGFLRLGAALKRLTGGLPQPVYRLMFSDAYTFGFSPTPRALDTYLGLLDELDPGAPWMVAGLGVSIDPLLAVAAERGGHIRVGLEDVPPQAERSNLELVREAAALMARHGHGLADAAAVRRSLAGG